MSIIDGKCDECGADSAPNLVSPMYCLCHKCFDGYDDEDDLTPIGMSDLMDDAFDDNY